MRSSTSWGLLPALLCATALTAGCDRAPPIDHSGPVAGWENYGASPGGDRYSPLTQITPENVRFLKKAWTYNIGEIDAEGFVSPTFQATPIVVDDRMFLCSGNGRISSIDPETGKEIWKVDLKPSSEGAYLLNCRGVSHYRDPAPASPTCASRIIAGTLDARLVVLDAATGEPCHDFANNGAIALTDNLGTTSPGQVAVSSPPVIIGDTVVVNHRIADNMTVDIAGGVIRAYDVRTGALRWAWDPVPPGAPPRAADAPYHRSTPNSWAPMSVDPALGLIYVPMGNAGPDHISLGREDRDYYSSSLVALDAKTGEPRWHFQTVRRDVWDYDIPAQPSLVDLPGPGGMVPAVVQTTKQGHIFVLNRATGKPIFPVEERPVPQAGALPGEKLSPTQPFPANPSFIIRRDLTEDDIWGFTPYDKNKCLEQFRSANWEGVFTPVSTRGTILFPSFMGASNWGGVAIDPQNKIMVVNTTQVPAILKMIPRAEADQMLARGEQILPNVGGTYGHSMKPMLSPFGAPCIRPPWGTMVAIDLKNGKRLWEQPLGTLRDMAPFPVWFKWGVPSLGGPMMTGTGLVFIGATTDRYLRAIDARNGEVLWKARLPAGGQATPMTYRLKKNGKQYVVIAAGGHKYLGTRTGDSLVAFALED